MPSTGPGGSLQTGAQRATPSQRQILYFDNIIRVRNQLNFRTRQTFHFIFPNQNLALQHSHFCRHKRKEWKKLKETLEKNVRI